MFCRSFGTTFAIYGTNLSTRHTSTKIVTVRSPPASSNGFVTFTSPCTTCPRQTHFPHAPMRTLFSMNCLRILAAPLIVTTTTLLLLRRILQRPFHNHAPFTPFRFVLHLHLHSPP